MNKKGLVHIYCGEGKGKTTAATGLAVRMAGYGEKILFTRFLKNESSGELKILDRIEEIEVLHLPRSFGFYNTLNEEQKADLKKMYRAMWEAVKTKIKEEHYNMLVMDEVLHAVRYELITENELVEFLRERPDDLEVVLTGRDPSERLCGEADYISEIRKIKHPYDKGIMARKGIEY